MAQCEVKLSIPVCRLDGTVVQLVVRCGDFKQADNSLIQCPACVANRFKHLKEKLCPKPLV